MMGDVKKNVILMGDIIEDHHMVDNQRHDNVLRIGFLNKKETCSDEFMFELKRYKEKFDLVISEDGSICPILHIFGLFGDHEVSVKPEVVNMEGFDEL